MKILNYTYGVDGSKKFLLRTDTGECIESVYFENSELCPSSVFCLSTQIGCQVNCKFCASAALPFRQNLTSKQIFAQLKTIASSLPEIQNARIAFMGIGEPFHNYSNLIDSMDIILKERRKLSERISIATIGIPSLLRKFAFETRNIPQVNLQISLHFSSDSKRHYYMPGTKNYSLNDLIKECVEYVNITGRRVFILILLLKGVNDKMSDLMKLTQLLAPLKKESIIKLAEYNSIGKINHFYSSSDIHKNMFRDFLVKDGFNVELSQSLGTDIKGGCGQMRINYEANKF